jgi:KaiC/GvpD/RAD55 family RecA-like ATPase
MIPSKLVEFIVHLTFFYVMPDASKANKKKMNRHIQKKVFRTLYKKQNSVLLRQEKTTNFSTEPYETRHDCHS